MPPSIMASNFLQKPGSGASPLQGLADYFKEAQAKAGIISLPHDTLQKIIRYRAQGSEHSAEEIRPVVQALEPCDTHMLRRLDAQGLTVICSVLVHAQICMPQWRGLYLLAEALYTHRDQPGSKSGVTDKAAKKVAIGSQALAHLVKGFVTAENNIQTRRWMGVLALELLKDCRPNTTILRADQSKMKCLTMMIKESGCQVLKLLAGSMINVLLNHGVMPALLWSDTFEESLYMQFPTMEVQDTQWVTSFEGYVNKLMPDAKDIQKEPVVLFAYAVSIGNDRYTTIHESAIIATVSEDLNIFIPESTTSPALYIDVPFTALVSIEIEGQANSQSQEIKHVLIMHLSRNTKHTCFLNAAAKNCSSIALAFALEKDAQILVSLLQSQAAQGSTVGRLSISEGVMVSQATSDDQSSSPSMQNNYDLHNSLQDSFQPDGAQAQQDNHNLADGSRTISVAHGLDISQPQTTKQKAKPASKEKAKEITPKKIDGRVQKQVQAPKKATITERKVNAIVENLNDTNSVYDLQASPESSIRPEEPVISEAKEDVTQGAAPVSQHESKQGQPIARSKAKSSKKPGPIVEEITAEKSGSHTKAPEKEMQSDQPGTAYGKPAPTKRAGKAQVVSDQSKSKSRSEPKAKSIPVPSSTVESRPKREAAKKANAKIYGMETDDGAATHGQDQAALADSRSKGVTGDHHNPAISRHANKKVVKSKDTNQAIKTKTSKPKPPLKNQSSSRSDIHVFHEELDSLSENHATSERKLSGSDQVQLVGGTLLNMGARNAVGYGDSVKIQEETMATGPTALITKQSSATNKEEQAADRPFMPDSVPHASEDSFDVEEHTPKHTLREEVTLPDELSMIGDAEDSHFREAMGMRGEEALHSSRGSNQTSHPPPSMTPKQNKRATIPTRKIRDNLQVDDPFGVRLETLASPARTSKNSRSANVQTVDDSVSVPIGSTGREPQEKKTPKSGRCDERPSDDLQHKAGKKGATTLPGPTAGSKRSLEEDDMKQTKKAKLAPQDETNALPKKGKTGNRASTRTPKTVNRKPELISWDTSGPRNQGTVSAKSKPLLPEPPVAHPDEPVLKERVVSKRKFAALQDEAPFEEHTQSTKRHKIDFSTPSQSRNHVPEMTVEPTTSVRQHRANRLGSQSQKVNDNGSPLPTSQIRTESQDHYTMVNSATLILNEDENGIGGDDDCNASEPQLPAANQDIQPGRNVRWPVVMTSKGKQYPSSPFAPSALTTMPGHLEFDSGRLVNNETFETINPIQPQDPFSAPTEKPPSSFVKVLRKSTIEEPLQNNEDAKEAVPPKGLKRKSLNENGEDPERTLVELEPEPEPKPKRRKTTRKLASIPSSSSKSTSEDVSSEKVASEKADDVAARQWLETLEPENAQMLDILTLVTHRLVRHLVSKEIAVKDLLKDYEIGGKSLIKGYEKERQNALDIDRDSLNMLKRSMSIIYMEAQDKARAIAQETQEKTTRQTDKLRKRLEEEEKARSKALNAAVAACLPEG